MRVAPIALRPRASSRPFYIEADRAELLKYLGLAAMLVDHFALYVLHREPTDGVTYLVGRFAFPFFVLAFAAGMASPRADLVRSFRRLLPWAACAQLACLLVRAPLPLNVLVTFALGLALLIVPTIARARWSAIAATVAILFVAGFVEFVHGGVLFVAAAVYHARRPSWWTPWAVVGTCALVCLVNGNAVALGALGLAWLVAQVPIELRRVRFTFHVAYVAQYPLLAVMRVLL